MTLKDQIEAVESAVADWPEWKKKAASEDFPVDRSIPTIEDTADTQARLLDLTSRRLIQFVDARNEALRLLDPKKVDGVKPPPDVEWAIAVLKATTVLK
jgi:hypothetical protein